MSNKENKCTICNRKMDGIMNNAERKINKMIEQIQQMFVIHYYLDVVFQIIH